MMKIRQKGGQTEVYSDFFKKWISVHMLLEYWECDRKEYNRKEYNRKHADGCTRHEDGMM